MEPPELIRLETLLRYRLSERGELRPRPGQEPGDVPSLLAYRFVGGFLCYPRQGLPPDTRERLACLPPQAAFERPTEVSSILGHDGDRSVDVLYRMIRPPAAEAAEGVSRQGDHFVVLAESRPVAWAWTIEEHGLAQRGTVETVERFRRQGHGRRALAAWCRHVLGRQKIAIVGHREEDVASQGLLRSLGAEEFATRAAFP